MSHGNHESHEQVFKKILMASDILQLPVGIPVDCVIQRSVPAGSKKARSNLWMAMSSPLLQEADAVEMMDRIASQAGISAHIFSSVRPTTPIIAFTGSQHTYSRMSSFWGCRYCI